MKFISALALSIMTSAVAFQQVQPAHRVSSALFITKEEDLELTRKVIQDFEKGTSTTAVEDEKEAPAPDSKKEKAAAKEE